MDIDVHKVKEHYEIYVDGKFKQSCDLNELQEVIKEIENEEIS